MRLIATLKNKEQGQFLSEYLHKQAIDNELEISTNTDWGSSEYGDCLCKVWIIHESELTKAIQITEEFIKNPLNPIYQLEKKPFDASSIFHSGKRIIYAISRF